MYQIGATYADPLEIKLGKSCRQVLSSTCSTPGIETHICVLDLNDLIRQLQKYEDLETLFTRNVRLKRDSIVNDGIKATYQHDTENFFLGNNGVHVLTTKANFTSGKVELQHPAIINGGQTLRTVASVKKLRTGAEILARITMIPRDMQTKEEIMRLTDDIIFRSNSNNEMEIWDLRSNDQLQVQLARELYPRRIYYERKTGEYDEFGANFASDITFPVWIVDLAKIIGICNTRKRGPAEVKQGGNEKLFKMKKDGGDYEWIFKEALSDMDTTESKIRLHKIISQASAKAKGRIIRKSKYFPTFHNAARDYTLGIMWDLIEDSELNHPLKMNYHKKSKLTKEVADINVDMFELFKKELTSGEITQNNLFRNNQKWREAKKKLGTQKRKELIVQAIKSDLGI